MALHTKNTKKIYKKTNKNKKHKKIYKRKNNKTNYSGTLLLLLLTSVDCFQLAGLPEKLLQHQCFEDTHTLSPYYRSESKFISNHDTLTTRATLALVGHGSIYYHRGIKLIRWKSRSLWISNKIRNKQIKTMNGNREIRNIIKITHCTLENKVQRSKKLEGRGCRHLYLTFFTPSYDFMSNLNVP